MTALRVCALICSLFGYHWALAEKTRPEFAPGISFAMIGSLLFLAGMINALEVAAVMLCGFGLLLFANRLFLRTSPAKAWSFSCLVLLAAILYFLPMLYGLKLTGYDDFSHWGVVARILVSKNRFPNITDQIVTFQAYPTGSAAIIYFFTKISGIQDEWIWLYAQAVTIMSLYMGLFAFARNWKERVAMLLVFMILLCSNIFFINLLVDTEITACALSSMCFALFYRNNLIKMRWWMLPYAAFLLALKTSGIFYVLVLFGYVLLKSRGTGSWKKLLPVALLSFIPLLLWRAHVRAVFPEGMLTKHAFSLEYFARTISDKNWSGMKYILVQLVLRTISPQLEAVYLLLFLGMILVLFRGEWEKKGALLREVVMIILVSAAAYSIMLYVMYLISMPWFEAEQLAGFERYLRTYTAFSAGLLTVALLQLPELESKTREKNRFVLVSVWVLLLLFTMGRRSDFFLRWPMEYERRTYAESILSEQDIPEQEQCFVVMKGEREDRGYLQYMFRYLLNSPNVIVCTTEERNTDYVGQEGFDIAWDPAIEFN